MVYQYILYHKTSTHWSDKIHVCLLETVFKALMEIDKAEALVEHDYMMFMLGYDHITTVIKWSTQISVKHVLLFYIKK